MKTNKINLVNVDSFGNTLNEVSLRDATVGHVNYALSQVDYVSGKDTEFNARGRVVFNTLGAVKVSTFESGELVVGNKYRIEYFAEGDDFTNVGASENAVGVVFTATGTTPANFSNGSVLANNAAQRVVDAYAKYSSTSKLPIFWVLSDADTSANRNLQLIGAPAVMEEKQSYLFQAVDYKGEDVEFFSGFMTAIVLDIKIYDSTFPKLSIGLNVNAKTPFISIYDESVDFRNYKVWSTPVLGIYVANADGAAVAGDYAKQSAGVDRAAATSAIAFLSDLVNAKTGTIDIPVVNSKTGLRFDFELRTYEYTAPAPVVVEPTREELQGYLREYETLIEALEKEGVDKEDELYKLYISERDRIQKVLAEIPVKEEEKLSVDERREAIDAAVRAATYEREA